MSNNNSKSTSTSGGIGFFGLLTIAFIVLKLGKVIKWSWWWVTCPIWSPIALVIIGFLIYLPFKVLKDRDKRNRIAAGYNEIAWKKDGKSKWQQRMEQIQEAQKLRENK
jgi:hypothetical protein